MSKNLVYMGTPDFAVVPLLAIVEAGHFVSAVYTQPDKPAGRGRALTPPPVKTVAERLGLEVVQPASLRDKSVQEQLLSLRPDAIVVAAYAQLLPSNVLSIPHYGCLNIHASLLPRYRGGAPVHWAVMNGDSETGVTIMRMDRGLDTGDILLQDSISIGEEDTSGDVTTRLSLLGAKLIVDALARQDLGEDLRRAQQHNLATYARNIRKEDGRVNWNLPAATLHNLIRGLNPWPLAYTYYGGQYLRVLRSRVYHMAYSLGPGELKVDDGRLLVGTGLGTLQLMDVQPAGKRVMTGSEFARGYLQGREKSFQFS